ncbi:MAG: FKBP-type peptidyl-prolyl cis-trans isomerase [Planctomycetes bacterium]|nr:FKBP-type peptidyl-prolyl cis-trans isomerase [Planctomycetota bacterium]
MRLTLAFACCLFLAACGRDEPEPQRKLSPAAENRVKGQRFLRDNATKPGWVVTGSGLQYRIISTGSGPKPRATDTVRVHYVGRFVDGTTFESSRDRGDAPAALPLRRLLRGWQEGIPMMPIGSTWEFAIPSNLAYGLDNAPESIGPNQTLVFTIELIGVE